MPPHAQRNIFADGERNTAPPARPTPFDPLPLSDSTRSAASKRRTADIVPALRKISALALGRPAEPHFWYQNTLADMDVGWLPKIFSEPFANERV
jgi:hypothetical protein